MLRHARHYGVSPREFLAMHTGPELVELWVLDQRLEPLPDPYWCAGLVACEVARLRWVVSKFVFKNYNERFPGFADYYLPEMAKRKKPIPTAEQTRANFEAFVTVYNRGRR